MSTSAVMQEKSETITNSPNEQPIVIRALIGQSNKPRDYISWFRLQPTETLKSIFSCSIDKSIYKVLLALSAGMRQFGSSDEPNQNQTQLTAKI